MGNIAVVAVILFISVTLALDIFAMDGTFITSIVDGMSSLASQIQQLFNNL